VQGEFHLKLTPVLFVEQIEAVLPFWTQRLGFIKAVEACPSAPRSMARSKLE
jgi:hypothetical protein